MDALRGSVSQDVLDGLAAQLGETPETVAKGMESGFSALLSALASRAGDAAFLKTLRGLLEDPALTAEGPALSSLAERFLAAVFGERRSAVTAALAQAAGMTSESAAGLLSRTAPLVMAFLSREMGSAGAAGLARMLGGEPGGSAAKWILPALLVAIALLGTWWFTRKPPTEVEQAAREATQEPAWAALGELFARKLPDGVELNLPKLGVENRLIDFLSDAGKEVDKTTWFDFDRLLFDTGKATLQPASQEQLKNVAAILKAFPSVEMKIGGYTDNTGDAQANQALSDARAKAVAGELVKLGVAPGRLSAEGYGDQHPVASNATEEGRQKNRRVSMRVTKK